VRRGRLCGSTAALSDSKTGKKLEKRGLEGHRNDTSLETLCSFKGIGDKKVIQRRWEIMGGDDETRSSLLKEKAYYDVPRKALVEGPGPQKGHGSEYIQGN